MHVPLVISLSASSGPRHGECADNHRRKLPHRLHRRLLRGDRRDCQQRECSGTTDEHDQRDHHPLTSTQITVWCPFNAGGTYYPIVTLPSGYLSSPFNASQAYNQPADTFAHTARPWPMVLDHLSLKAESPARGHTGLRMSGQDDGLFACAFPTTEALQKTNKRTEGSERGDGLAQQRPVHPSRKSLICDRGCWRNTQESTMENPAN